MIAFVFIPTFPLLSFFSFVLSTDRDIRPTTIPTEDEVDGQGTFRNQDDPGVLQQDRDVRRQFDA